MKSMVEGKKQFYKREAKRQRGNNKEITSINISYDTFRGLHALVLKALAQDIYSTTATGIIYDNED